MFISNNLFYLLIMLLFCGNSLASKEEWNIPNKAHGEEILLELVSEKENYLTDDYFENWIHSNVLISTDNNIFSDIFNSYYNEKSIEFISRTLLGKERGRNNSLLTGCSRNKDLCDIYYNFGRERGVRMIYLLSKFGINVSSLTAHSNNVSKYVISPMSLEEINRIIISCEIIPFQVFDKLKSLAIGLVDEINERTHGNSAIYLYRSWREASKLMQIGVVIHEIGHNLARDLNEIDDSEKWINFRYKYGLGINGYDGRGGIRQAVTPNDGTSDFLKEKCLISEYSQENPSEDFAETFVSYITNKELLRDVCYDKFEFMEERVFDY